MVAFASLYEIRIRLEPIPNVARMDAVLNREEGTKVHPAAAIVRKPLPAVLFLTAGLAATILFLVYGAGPHAARASSHSEAPLISQDPRADNTDLIYRSEEGKFRAVVEEIKDRHEAGQPVLVGTTSVEISEHLSDLLNLQGIESYQLTAELTVSGGWGAQVVTTFRRRK